MGERLGRSGVNGGEERARVPRLALVLGYAGLLPMAGALLLVAYARVRLAADPYPFFHGPWFLWQQLAAFGSLIYAGLILSFLGGMWWGQASRAFASESIFAGAVVPSLLAFALLLLGMLGVAWTGSPRRSLIALGAAIVATLPIDQLLVRRGIAPLWWMRLRVPLSLGLGLGTIAIGLLAFE